MLEVIDFGFVVSVPPHAVLSIAVPVHQDTVVVKRGQLLPPCAVRYAMAPSVQHGRAAMCTLKRTGRRAPTTQSGAALCAIAQTPECRSDANPHAAASPTQPPTKHSKSRCLGTPRRSTQHRRNRASGGQELFDPDDHSRRLWESRGSSAMTTTKYHVRDINGHVQGACPSGPHLSFAQPHQAAPASGLPRASTTCRGQGTTGAGFDNACTHWPWRPNTRRMIQDVGSDEVADAQCTVAA